ncbi:hypothetical protein CRYPD_905 [uncultured Candidatus Thioglobus sp.]|nr:hypothetical protein CRYPD_905 [uncultured Candidatus Thioglobus sp.]
MFHLLVSYQEWSSSGGSLANSRVYINKDEEPGSSFYTNGTLDTSKISKYPALLVTETGGDGMQFARVAHITQVVQSHNETVIQYAIDSSIAPISNNDLENYPTELHLGRFGLSHTHWRVCDADLFKLLLHNQQKTLITSKVFSIDAIYAQDRNLVSVMMPFSAEFNTVYTSIQAATVAVSLSCVRADDIWEEHAIIQDVVNIIARARVVICDCSGKNPNVFYEAGIAHTLGKEVILIAQSKDDIPFDLRHLRCIFYLPNTEGLEALSQSLQTKLRSITGK